MEIKYDDSELQKMFNALDYRNRLKAMRGGLRREASHVRKQAIANLHAASPSVTKEMEKGVRQEVLRKSIGFKVTIATKRQKKSAKNERLGYSTGGKPYELVNIWLDQGTDYRHTKPKGTRWRTWVKRKAHATGRVRASRYMLKTLRQVRDNVTSELQEEMRNYIVKTAKKYGCN